MNIDIVYTFKIYEDKNNLNAFWACIQEAWKQVGPIKQ